MNHIIMMLMSLPLINLFLNVEAALNNWNNSHLVVVCNPLYTL